MSLVTLGVFAFAVVLTIAAVVGLVLAYRNLSGRDF
jgi:hypothetical protein